MDADVTGLFSPLSPHVAHARAAAARGAAAESAWRVKDCFELVTRFLAVACVAELLQSSRPAEEDAALLFQSLANPRGLSLGQWLSVLRDSVRKNRSHGGALDGVRGALLRRGSGGLRLSTIDEFVRWRNATIGHGLLPLNATEVLVDAQRWLEQLDVLLRELRDAAPDVQLCTAADDGSLVEWHHLHLASHSPDSHDLSAAVGVLLAHPAGAVPLSPWLQAAACRPCGALVLWFFDRIGDEDRPSLFQDAHGGHRRRLPAPALEALRRAAGKLEFSYEVVDDELLSRLEEAARRAHEVTYVEPASIVQAIEAALAEAPIVRVVGDAGTGKTYLMRALAESGAQRTILLPVGPGQLADDRVFAVRLEDAVRDAAMRRPTSLNVAGDDAAAVRGEYARWLSALLRANRLDQLVIAIDGLDELDAPPKGRPPILDCLPAPAEVPGVAYVVASRPTIGVGTEASLARLAGPSPRVIALGPAQAAYRDLLERYLAQRVAAGRIPAAWSSPILERAQGCWLYVAHLCDAVEAGAYTQPGSLPFGRALYDAYLDVLRDRAGEALFSSSYETVLHLLAAAAEPVDLDLLHEWGAPGDHIGDVLWDLKGFLRTDRSGEQPARIGLSHADFRELLTKSAPHVRGVEAAHRAIAAWALETIESASPASDAHLLYARRYVAWHARRGADEALKARVFTSGAVPEAMCAASTTLWGRGRVVESLRVLEDAWLVVDYASQRYRTPRPHAASDIHVRIGHRHAELWHPEKAVAHARLAVELSAAGDQPETRFEALCLLSDQLMNLGDAGGAGEALAEADHLLDRLPAGLALGARRGVALARARVMLARGEVMDAIGRLQELERHLTDAAASDPRALADLVRVLRQLGHALERVDGARALAAFCRLASTIEDAARQGVLQPWHLLDEVEGLRKVAELSVPGSDADFGEWAASRATQLAARAEEVDASRWAPIRACCQLTAAHVKAARGQAPAFAEILAAIRDLEERASATTEAEWAGDIARGAILAACNAPSPGDAEACLAHAVSWAARGYEARPRVEEASLFAEANEAHAGALVDAQDPRAVPPASRAVWMRREVVAQRPTIAAHHALAAALWLRARALLLAGAREERLADYLEGLHVAVAVVNALCEGELHEADVALHDGACLVAARCAYGAACTLVEMGLPDAARGYLRDTDELVAAMRQPSWAEPLVAARNAFVADEPHWQRCLDARREALATVPQLEEVVLHVALGEPVYFAATGTGSGMDAIAGILSPRAPSLLVHTPYGALRLGEVWAAPDDAPHALFDVPRTTSEALPTVLASFGAPPCVRLAVEGSVTQGYADGTPAEHAGVADAIERALSEAGFVVTRSPACAWSGEGARMMGWIPTCVDDSAVPKPGMLVLVRPPGAAPDDKGPPRPGSAARSIAAG